MLNKEVNQNIFSNWLEILLSTNYQLEYIEYILINFLIEMYILIVVHVVSKYICIF